MNSVVCPRCGAANEPNAAFCATCGNPLANQAPTQPPAQPPTPPAAPQPGWPPSANVQQAPPGFQPPPGAIPAQGYQPPPGYPPPPGGYAPPPPGYPMPGAKITGSNTKWAFGLAIGSLFCCGPVLSIPGIFMAKKDMDDFTSGRAPQLDFSLAKGAYYLNIVLAILGVIGLLFWFGMGGLHRF